MTATHTPGPWSATGYHVEARAGAIATVCDAGNGDTEGDANARLIAAAPDLLVIVRALIDIAGTSDELDGTGHHDMADLVRMAQAAIARATGTDA